MNVERIRQAGELRKRALEEYELTHREALDVVVEELERDPEGGNIARAAALIGVTRPTIYNELGRRQERRDALEGNGAGQPPPAPADTDEPERTAA